MRNLSDDDRSQFYTTSAILLGIYKQVIEQVGHRPFTNSRSIFASILEYLLDAGQTPGSVFSKTTMWSYVKAVELVMQPLDRITQVRDLTIFQLQARASIDHLHTINLLFDDALCLSPPLRKAAGLSPCVCQKDALRSDCSQV